MQNHHREPSPTARKPPRPPSLSASIPSDPDPPTRPEPVTEFDESPHSPLRSDDPDEKLAVVPSPGAMMAAEKYYSPLTSPLPITPPKDAATPDNFPPPLPPSSHHHIISFNRREEALPHTGVVYGGGGRGDRKETAGFEKPSRKEVMVKKVGLGIRVLEVVFCLVSFSVMAANKTQGWSGDSFYRYKEYRFCLAVNILGFVYSGFQAYNLAYHLATRKHVITRHIRYQFDFIMDQIIAYLIISASSAAATRVEDWEANWGKDEFTEKASASIGMAFLAFIGFATSSLFSGYNLCNRN